MTSSLVPAPPEKPTARNQILTRIGISKEAVGVWAAGVGLVIVLALVAATARPWGAPIVVIAVLGVGAYYSRVLGYQTGLVVLLIVTALADRFTFPVGSVALRAEQIAAVAAVAALAVPAVREHSWGWLKPNLPEALLLAWFAANVISTLLGSPDKHLSAKIFVLYAVCSLGIFLPRRMLAASSRSRPMETVTRWLLIFLVTQAAFGTIAYLLHIAGPTVALGVNPATGYFGAYGTLWEQNVFGALCASGLVAWAYLGPPRFRLTWAALAFSLGGLAVSITRAAWLAAAAVGALGLLLPGTRRRLNLRVLFWGILSGAGLIAVTIAAASTGGYRIPIQTAPGGAQPNGGAGTGSGLLSAMLNRIDVIGRFNQISLVRDDIRHHLLFGRGTAGFEALHQVNGLPEHLASLPLNVLDGTGLIGLLLFSAFAAAVFAHAWSQRHDEKVVALGQVGFVVAITTLSTETLELMVGWLLIGLLLAAVDAAAMTEGDTIGTRS